MEYAKKMVLIPEDQIQTHEYLSKLDQRMKSILQSRKLSTDEKALLYLQVLQQYTNITHEKSREEVKYDPPLPMSEDLPSKEDKLKTKLLQSAPKRYKDTVNNIYSYLETQPKIQWNDKGEIIFNEKMYHHTNIVHLINDLVRNQKKSPFGRKVFLSMLQELKLPEHLDINKKLNTDMNVKKIIKPIMYAQRWLKL